MGFPLGWSEECERTHLKGLMNKDKIKIKLRHNQKPVVNRQVVLQSLYQGARGTYLEAPCGEVGGPGNIHLKF